MAKTSFEVFGGIKVNFALFKAQKKTVRLFKIFQSKSIVFKPPDRKMRLWLYMTGKKKFHATRALYVFKTRHFKFSELKPALMLTHPHPTQIYKESNMRHSPLAMHLWEHKLLPIARARELSGISEITGTTGTAGTAVLPQTVYRSLRRERSTPSMSR